MKITGKKNIEAERLRGREAIDAVYVPRISRAMGPKFALYQAKASAAQFGATKLSPEDDAVEILSRFDALLDSIAVIETERQATQAKVDTATTASEIDAIIAAL